MPSRAGSRQARSDRSAYLRDHLRCEHTGIPCRAFEAHTMPAEDLLKFCDQVRLHLVLISVVTPPPELLTPNPSAG